MKTIGLLLMVVLTFINVEMITAQKVFTNELNIANNGYDLVNYFTSNTAVRGSKDFAFSYEGATYYFINEENMKVFKNAPGNYLPQFGGYCAFAVAKMKQRVPVDPKTFRIDDGKLYLFYNDYWEGKPFNTIIPWLNDEESMEKAAYANWKILDQKKE